MKNAKRILATLLAALMVCGCMAVGASAAEDDQLPLPVFTVQPKGETLELNQETTLNATVALPTLPEDTTAQLTATWYVKDEGESDFRALTVFHGETNQPLTVNTATIKHSQAGTHEFYVEAYYDLSTGGRSPLAKSNVAKITVEKSVEQSFEEFFKPVGDFFGEAFLPLIYLFIPVINIIVFNRYISTPITGTSWFDQTLLILGFLIGFPIWVWTGADSVSLPLPLPLK
ncbi:MAG: hypothetical protein LBS96_10345 [Oscillospiraceae bacterium]|jgi:hypothetical protein|nr:hypothetical protein [Oscillospiraceae bacterium]